MEKHHYKILLVIFVLIAALGFIFVKFSAKPQKGVIFSPPPMPVAEAQAPELTKVDSPDGKLTLTMKKEKTQNGVFYSFFTTDLTGVKNIVFTKIASAGATFSIPANTFSPDNKYIFLKEEYLGQTDYFLPTESGISDISSLFAARYPDYVVTDITGWGGINLIVINTDEKSGEVGPSFWFDVPYKNFIRLSTRFN